MTCAKGKGLERKEVTLIAVPLQGRRELPEVLLPTKLAALYLGRIKDSFSLSRPPLGSSVEW